jgi:hypothetical protein
MNRYTFLFSFIITLAFLLSSANYTQEKPEHKYIGAEKCGMCHKSEKQGQQLKIWKESMHSKAYETLKSEKADQIAKSKGLKTPAAENEKCLKCHVSGYNVDKSMLEAKFQVSDGVQCETCHGPGSDYAPLKIMKDPAAAAKNGLIIHKDKEKFCKGCHNSESPTFKGFDYDKYWAKIQHPIPKS